MNGEFCTACGARAQSPQAGPAPAAANVPRAAPAAARKTSPIVWILVAAVGIFVLFGIAVVGAGLFVVHKAKQAGLDTELMRNNPGLATARLLAATNPDLEVVSDDGHGRITIRQKSTGKTMTVTFDDLRGGRFTFHEDGKDTVTLDAHGAGETGGLQMKSGSESLTVGANQPVALPSWIPAYPNSTPVGTFSRNGKEGSSAGFQFQTQDAPKDIIAFYERELKQTGFRISGTVAGNGGPSSGGLVSADDAANKRTVMVTVGHKLAGTTVSVAYWQR
jgi:hypothetical protein